MRIVSPFLTLIAFSLLASCGRASNALDEIVLQCGEAARNKEQYYFPVLSRQGARLMTGELKVHALTSERKRTDSSEFWLTDRGCLIHDGKQTLLAHHPASDSFALVEPESLSTRQTVQVEDLSSVKPWLLFSSLDHEKKLALVFTPLPAPWAPFFKVNVSVQDASGHVLAGFDDLSYESNKSLALNEIISGHNTFNVSILVHDDLRNRDDRFDLSFQTTVISINL